MTTLLERLEGVRPGNGVGVFLARCPSHDDKAPSLKVTVREDGSILLHCYAGCPPAEVLASIGMSLSDLFPERDTAEYKSQRRRVDWFDYKTALELIRHEALVVMDAANQLRKGEAIDEQRLKEASIKIGETLSHV